MEVGRVLMASNSAITADDRSILRHYLDMKISAKKYSVSNAKFSTLPSKELSIEIRLVWPVEEPQLTRKLSKPNKDNLCLNGKLSQTS